MSLDVTLPSRRPLVSARGTLVADVRGDDVMSCYNVSDAGQLGGSDRTVLFAKLTLPTGNKTSLLLSCYFVCHHTCMLNKT